MYSESFATSLSDAEKLCTLEAEAAVSETAFGVRDIRIAEALPFSESLAYLNLTTLEGERLCVEISARGFRPVGVELVNTSHIINSQCLSSLLNGVFCPDLAMMTLSAQYHPRNRTAHPLLLPPQRLSNSNTTRQFMPCYQHEAPNLEIVSHNVWWNA